MNLELTFGKQQYHTSYRMNKYPVLGKCFNRIFGYTNVGNYARFTVFKKLIEKINLPVDAKILDLGTGYGEYSFSLAKAAPETSVHALDIDPERIQTVRQTVKKCGFGNITVHQQRIEELEEDQFDFIFSIDVFEHILPEEMPFKAAFDRLRSGGHFMVKIPNKDQQTILPEGWFEEHHEWLEDEHVGQVYDLESLGKRLEAEGFELVFGIYSDGWLSRLAWELAYLGKKAGLITQLLSLPLAKSLIQLDRLFHSGQKGNAIQVIGRKP